MQRTKQLKMKKIVFLSITTILFLISCSGSQQITSTWVDQSKIPQEPYQSIFVVALIPNNVQRASVEEKMAKLLKKRGVKAIKSINSFPGNLSAIKKLSKEEQLKIIKDSGCEGVLILTELDVKADTRYIPSKSPAPLPPFRYRYYDSYFSYYTHRNAQVTEPGYMEKETTYFFETNF
jgi:uncharacterized membrane protein